MNVTELIEQVRRSRDDLLTNFQVPSPINMETLGVDKGWKKIISCKKYSVIKYSV